VSSTWLGLGLEKTIREVAVETFAVPGRGIANAGGACPPLQACAGEAKSVAPAQAPATMKIDFIEYPKNDDTIIAQLQALRRPRHKALPSCRQEAKLQFCTP
jgi:hypothetical protein